MIISTRGKNALKLMLDLANNNSGDLIRLKDIATRQNISEKYLEHIVSRLHKERLVESVRGKNGGYSLSFSPEQYTVGRILRAVENNMHTADCYGANSVPCPNKANCANYRLWARLDDAINGVLDDITLADMMELQTDTYVI